MSFLFIGASPSWPFASYPGDQPGGDYMILLRTRLRTIIRGPNRFGSDPLAANPFPNQQFGAPA
jgi:hypothetical protein